MVGERRSRGRMRQRLMAEKTVGGQNSKMKITEQNIGLSQRYQGIFIRRRLSFELVTHSIARHSVQPKSAEISVSCTAILPDIEAKSQRPHLDLTPNGIHLHLFFPLTQQFNPWFCALAYSKKTCRRCATCRSCRQSSSIAYRECFYQAQSQWSSRWWQVTSRFER